MCQECAVFHHTAPNPVHAGHDLADCDRPELNKDKNTTILRGIKGLMWFFVNINLFMDNNMLQGKGLLRFSLTSLLL